MISHTVLPVWVTALLPTPKNKNHPNKMQEIFGTLDQTGDPRCFFSPPKGLELWSENPPSKTYPTFPGQRELSMTQSSGQQMSQFSAPKSSTSRGDEITRSLSCTEYPWAISAQHSMLERLKGGVTAAESWQGSNLLSPPGRTAWSVKLHFQRIVRTKSPT